MPKFKKHARAVYVHKESNKLHGMSFGYDDDDWWLEKIKYDTVMPEYRCVALEVFVRRYWLLGKSVWKFKKPR